MKGIPVGTPAFTSVIVTEGDHQGRAGRLLNTAAATGEHPDLATILLDPSAELAELEVTIPAAAGDILR